MLPNSQVTADLVTLNEEIINKNFIFCAVVAIATCNIFLSLVSKNNCPL